MRSIAVAYRFFRANQGIGLLARFRRGVRGAQLVRYHEQKQWDQVNELLHNASSKDERLSFNEEMSKMLNSVRSRLTGSVYDSVQAAKSIKEEDVRNANRRIYGFFLEHLSNYYKSVQNLLEGRRQVLQDENFKFEDGQTVKEKELAFENKVRRLMGKLNK